MSDDEKLKFDEILKRDKAKKETEAKLIEKKLLEQDEYEIVKLY